MKSNAEMAFELVLKMMDTGILQPTDREKGMHVRALLSTYTALLDGLNTANPPSAQADNPATSR